MSDGELSFDEAKAVVDDIASFARPILILTGGEPLLCPHLFELIAYAKAKGLKSVIGTNATLIDETLAARIAAAGVPRISVSVDFPTAAEHDAFRGMDGAFAAALRGIRAAIRAGVEVQVNSTITKANRAALPQLHDLAVELGAKAFHPFLLVPTGRGKDLADVELTAAEYEEALGWICERQRTSPLELKPTDAPQYRRIVCQRRADDPSARTGKGCLAGTGFCFISHVGDVQPCGYFGLKLGNVREKPFGAIWRESPVLDDLRHPERLKGKCGACEYASACGGCRARALAKTGDYLAAEPSCAHVPDRWLLDALQTDFPLVERPYAELGRRLGLDEATCYERALSLQRRGLIRRLGASFDSRRLGFVPTLVAARVRADRLDAVAERIAVLPQVTHDYARIGTFNLWFTLIARDRDELRTLLSQIAAFEGVEKILELPATKTYKLSTCFAGKGGTHPRMADDAAKAEALVVTADALKALVRKFQGDVLGEGLSPFDAGELPQLKSLVANGTVRRFGAFADSRSLGLVANALTAWQVLDGKADAVGTALAAFPFVSHCYARLPGKGWPHGLYAMVHARTPDELDACLLQLAKAVGAVLGEPSSPVVLKTLREYKKASARHFVV